MSNRRLLAALTALAMTFAVVTAAGCGDSSDQSSGDDNAIGYAGDGDTKSSDLSTGSDDWTHFGRDDQRTHWLPGPDSLDPPAKQKWTFSDRVLIEFPPAVYDGIAYIADKYGNVRALRLEDQKVLWDIQKDHRNVGPPTDTTAPAYADGHVFVAFQGGEMVSFEATTGKVAWRRNMQTGLQSSPLAVDGKIYLGSEKGILFALDADTGKTEWTFKTETPIKTSPSIDGGRIFFANYSGSVFAVDAKTGKPDWETNTAGTAPGGQGGFYSSPAAAAGKIFLGRDDGLVYAFEQKTGKQAWYFQTEGDIYGSPAVAKTRNSPLTVYVGSYDSTLYALNAATGKKEWGFDVGGPVPGTATVVANTVYTSSFKTGYSIGVDIESHEKVFSYDSPGYTPMISDGKNLYLVGYYTLHGFEPGK